MFGGDWTGGAFQLHGSAEVHKFRDRVPGILEEPDVIPDELRRRVDLMRYAGSQLTDALEFLRLPKLQLQDHAIGDVGSGDDEPRLFAVLRRDAQNIQAQKPGLAFAF